MGSWQVPDGFLMGSWQVPLRKVFCVIVHICLRPWSATPFLATPLSDTPSVQVKVWAVFIFELERIKVSLQWKETGSRLTGTFLAPPSGSRQRW